MAVVGGSQDGLYFNNEKGQKTQHLVSVEELKSIYLTGLNSAALGGKEIYEKQLALILPFLPVLCLDNDAKGKKAGMA